MIKLTRAQLKLPKRRTGKLSWDLPKVEHSRSREFMYRAFKLNRTNGYEARTDEADAPEEVVAIPSNHKDDFGQNNFIEHERFVERFVEALEERR